MREIWTLFVYEPNLLWDGYASASVTRTSYLLPNAWLALWLDFAFTPSFTRILLVQYYSIEKGIGQSPVIDLAWTGRSKLKSYIVAISCLNLLKYTFQNLDLRESESAWISLSNQSYSDLNSWSPVTSSF